MQTIQFLLGKERKKYLKIILLVLVAYFFVGISEGAFLYFENSRDTLLNFLFTLVCVFSNWWIFKWVYRKTRGWFGRKPQKYFAPFVQVLVPTVYTIMLNWVYIEMLWQERLQNTAFFPVVLPLAIALFIAWLIGYHWLQQLERPDKKKVVLFELRRGRQTVFCSLEQTLGFVVENKLVFLFNQDGERLLIERSLTELENELSSHGFFRVNRQFLLSPKAVKAYKTIGNERLELTLVEVMEGVPTCFVSRYKAPAFRKWLNGSPSLGS